MFFDQLHTVKLLEKIEAENWKKNSHKSKITGPMLIHPLDKKLWNANAFEMQHSFELPYCLDIYAMR